MLCSVSNLGYLCQMFYFLFSCRVESFNEIRLLASVKNPNVISYKESFIEDDVLYIVKRDYVFYC